MDFLTLVKRRYACRQYQDRKVEPEKLQEILEAGRVAPTGANRQPQRLVVIQSKEGMERLARCTRDFGAPLAILVCAATDEAWTRKYDGKMIADIDASLGLDSLWICMFKPEAVREEFHLPDNVVPVNILLIGYGAGEPASPDRHDKLRKPLSETVFMESSKATREVEKQPPALLYITHLILLSGRIFRIWKRNYSPACRT